MSKEEYIQHYDAATEAVAEAVKHLQELENPCGQVADCLTDLQQIHECLVDCE